MPLKVIYWPYHENNTPIEKLREGLSSLQVCEKASEMELYNHILQLREARQRARPRRRLHDRQRVYLGDAHPQRPRGLPAIHPLPGQQPRLRRADVRRLRRRDRRVDRRGAREPCRRRIHRHRGTLMPI